jgi:hypothetical protein
MHQTQGRIVFWLGLSDLIGKALQSREDHQDGKGMGLHYLVEFFRLHKSLFLSKLKNAKAPLCGSCKGWDFWRLPRSSLNHRCEGSGDNAAF